MASSWEGRLGLFLFVGDGGKEACINQLLRKSLNGIALPLRRQDFRDCVFHEVNDRCIHMELIDLFISE